MKNIMSLAIIVTVLAMAGCATLPTSPTRPGANIDTTNGFTWYIVSISEVAEDTLGEPVLGWFSRDPDKDAGGIMLRGVKLTIYEYEYAGSDPEQRLVIAVTRLDDFLNALGR